VRSSQPIVKGYVSALLVSAVAMVGIDPRRLKVGVHHLIAKATFQRGSATKGKTLRLSFQRCPRALRAPRFTG
jgi:hypothetical protein